MTRTATTTDSKGRTITAELDTETGEVTITRDGIWSGSGKWDEQIIDCTACFGDDTDAVYDALDLGLME